MDDSSPALAPAAAHAAQASAQRHRCILVKVGDEHSAAQPHATQRRTQDPLQHCHSTIPLTIHRSPHLSPRRSDHTLFRFPLWLVALLCWSLAALSSAQLLQFPPNGQPQNASWPGRSKGCTIVQDDTLILSQSNMHAHAEHRTIRFQRTRSHLDAPLLPLLCALCLFRELAATAATFSVGSMTCIISVIPPAGLTMSLMPLVSLRVSVMRAQCTETQQPVASGSSQAKMERCVTTFGPPETSVRHGPHTMTRPGKEDSTPHCM